MLLSRNYALCRDGMCALQSLARGAERKHSRFNQVEVRVCRLTAVEIHQVQSSRDACMYVYVYVYVYVYMMYVYMMYVYVHVYVQAS